MLKRTLCVAVVAMFVWGFATMDAMAGPASDQLKGSIERILGILKDPVLKDPALKLERRNRIFKVVEERFDFTEMSRRSLGEFWSQINENQQKEFEVAFSRLVEGSYITKIEKYTDEKVNYGPEKAKGENAVSVRTEIVSSGRSTPVDYSLFKDGDQWQVYDVNVEGVSLVTNYRSQFSETLRKEGFTGLMSKLNEKVRKMEEESRG